MAALTLSTLNFKICSVDDVRLRVRAIIDSESRLQDFYKSISVTLSKYTFTGEVEKREAITVTLDFAVGEKLKAWREAFALGWKNIDETDAAERESRLQMRKNVMPSMAVEFFFNSRTEATIKEMEALHRQGKIIVFHVSRNESKWKEACHFERPILFNPQRNYFFSAALTTRDSGRLERLFASVAKLSSLAEFDFAFREITEMVTLSEEIKGKLASAVAQFDKEKIEIWAKRLAKIKKKLDEFDKLFPKENALTEYNRISNQFLVGDLDQVFYERVFNILKKEYEQRAIKYKCLLDDNQERFQEKRILLSENLGITLKDLGLTHWSAFSEESAARKKWREEVEQKFKAMFTKDLTHFDKVTKIEMLDLNESSSDVIEQIDVSNIEENQKAVLKNIWDVYRQASELLGIAKSAAF